MKELELLCLTAFSSLARFKRKISGKQSNGKLDFLLINIDFLMGDHFCSVVLPIAFRSPGVF